MKKYSSRTISLLAVLLGLLLASLLLLVTGKNPLDMFSALLCSLTGFDLSAPQKGFNLMYPLNWLLNCLPVMLTGLSVAFAYRTGMFNIGGEGQFIVGSLAASAVALFVPLPPIIHPIVCVIAGGLAGACWAFLPGLLKATRNINEVVICIMMNYIALYFNSWVVRTFLPVDQKTLARTIQFPASASFTPLNFGTSSKFHFGFLVVIFFLYMLLRPQKNRGAKRAVSAIQAASAGASGARCAFGAGPFGSTGMRSFLILSRFLSMSELTAPRICGLER